MTIDRPEVRNCVDGPTAAGLADAFRRFDAEDSLAVAVLTGAGGHFCAGADLKVVATGAANWLDEDGDGPMGPTRMQLSKPTIRSGETRDGAPRFAAGAGRHGSFANPK